LCEEVKICCVAEERTEAGEEQKRSALTYFVEELLKKASGKIVKIYLFGSLAKGTAREESDVDLLIVTNGDKTVEDLACEASFNTALAYSVSVEPFVMSIYEFNARKGGFFLREVEECGEVIYEMDKSEASLLEAQGYLDLAEEFLSYAKDALEQKALRPAIDEGYNAVELLVKALILLKGEHLASSHGGIVQQFGKLYSGEIERNVGKELRKALVERNKARYDPKAEITEENARLIVRLGEKLVKEVEKRIFGENSGDK